MCLKYELSEDDQRLLLATARQAICRRLGRVHELPQVPRTAALEQKAGAFVTLRREGMLRGCIGHLESSEPLYRTVADVAVAAAFEDPRFPALQCDEADSVGIQISVLTSFRRITDMREITVGVHGLLVRRGLRSGLLLPQVATEQGWGREELLEHTCRKAGLPGDAWLDPATKIEIFGAFVFGEGGQ